MIKALLVAAVVAATPQPYPTALPAQVVSVQDVDPGTVQEARQSCGYRGVYYSQYIPPPALMGTFGYITTWNFMCLGTLDKSKAEIIQMPNSELCPAGEHQTGTLVSALGVQTVVCSKP